MIKLSKAVTVPGPSLAICFCWAAADSDNQVTSAPVLGAPQNLHGNAKMKHPLHAMVAAQLFQLSSAADSKGDRAIGWGQCREDYESGTFHNQHGMAVQRTDAPNPCAR